MDWQSARRIALMVAVPAILCSVAARQVYLVNAHHLTSWKGGGFGMFATVPWSRNRILAIILVLRDGRQLEVSTAELQARMPQNEDLKDSVDLLIAMPTERAARQLAREAANVPWSIPDTRPGAAATVAEPKSLELASAIVEVWEYKFSSPDDELRLTRLQRVIEPVEDSQ